MSHGCRHLGFGTEQGAYMYVLIRRKLLHGFFTVLALTQLCTSVFAQDGPAVTKPLHKRGIVYIGVNPSEVDTRNADPIVRDFGAGTVVKYQQHLWLVTVTHVAATIQKGYKLGLQGGDDPSVWINMSDLVTDYSAKSWIADQEISILKLSDRSLTDKDLRLLRAYAIGPEEFATERPLQGVSVDVLGFPLRFGVSKKGAVKAVWQRTTVALESVELPDEWKLGDCLLVFPSTMTGSSGAPCYTTSEPHMFIGICTGALADSRGDKAGIVLPADRIRRVIEAATQQ